MTFRETILEFIHQEDTLRQRVADLKVEHKRVRGLRHACRLKCPDGGDLCDRVDTMVAEVKLHLDDAVEMYGEIKRRNERLASELDDIMD